jgi:hypothetical protein
LRGGKRAHRHLLLILANVVGVDGAQEGEVLLGQGHGWARLRDGVRDGVRDRGQG